MKINKFNADADLGLVEGKKPVRTPYTQAYPLLFVGDSNLFFFCKFTFKKVLFRFQHPMS